MTVSLVTFYRRSRRAPVTGDGGEKMRFHPARERMETEHELGIATQWLNDVQARYSIWLEWVDIVVTPDC